MKYKVLFGACLFCIVSGLFMISAIKYINKDEVEDKEDETITMKIIIDDIENVVLSGDTITYIRDTNNHLFEMDEFDPNILLCDPGRTIEVTFSKEFEDDNIIPVKNVSLYGVVPE